MTRALLSAGALEESRTAFEKALRGREELLAASGLPECATLKALRTEMRGEFLTSGDQFERAAMHVIALHQQDCAICRAREEYVQRHAAPLPPMFSSRELGLSPPSPLWIWYMVVSYIAASACASSFRRFVWRGVVLLPLLILLASWRADRRIEPARWWGARHLRRYALIGALVGGAESAVVLGVSVLQGDIPASLGQLWWLLLGLAGGAGLGSLIWLTQRSAAKRRGRRG
jgi:hypothetical protein